MDYKKILAATAVTSAAIVVPVVVQAEEVTPDEKYVTYDLIEADTLFYGDTLSTSVTKIKIDDETEETIISYEWIIDNVTIQGNTDTKLEIPINAIDETVYLVVTTDKGTKRSDKVEISVKDARVKFKNEKGELSDSNMALINSKITASNYATNLSAGEIITGFKWYIVDGKKYDLLTSDTSTDLTIPFKAQNKKLMFEVITEGGKHYVSYIKVAELNIDKEKLKIQFLVDGKVQNNADLAISAGDTITVRDFVVEGENGELLNSSLYSVTYKWYAITDNNVKVQIGNSTSSSFTIPVDSKEKEYVTFEVQAEIKVPSLDFSHPIIDFVKLNSLPAEDLITYIDALISTDYEYLKDYEEYDSGFELDEDDEELKGYARFEAYVKFLNTRYLSLSKNSQNTITNYAILQQANTDIQAVTPIIKGLEKFESSRKDVKVTHSELLKQFATIQKSYETLTRPQRSLLNFTDFNDYYVEKMKEWLNKSEAPEGFMDSEYITYKKINNLNDRIILIMNQNSNEYALDGNLEEFLANVKELSVEAKTFNKSYQPLLFTSILKTAESDVKIAKTVIEKIDKIDATDEKKKLTAIIAAQKAFNNLNPYQAFLVKAVAKMNLLNYTNQKLIDDQSTADTIVTAIADLKSDGIYKFDIAKLESEINRLTNEYKNSDATVKKLVTNYYLLTQAKTDVNTAKKVATLIDKAIAADKNTTGLEDKEALKIKKAAQSKYTTAYKALIKLTTSQLSIVEIKESNSTVDISTVNKFIDRYNELTIEMKTPVFKEDDEKAAEKFNVDKVGDVTSQIAWIEEMINSGNQLAEIEAEVTATKAAYKELTSYEKKLVYNYSYISVASSHITKAKSVQKKLNTATATNDLKKIATAITAYNKLDSLQKELIEADYEAAQTALGIENLDLEDQLVDLEENLEDLVYEFNYSYENISSISKLMNVLSTKEQKALKGYSNYQAALKDLKAVDSFIAKVLKLDESPSLSKKETIIKSYQKLSQKQITIFESLRDYLLNDDYSKAVSNVLQWNRDLQKNTSELNTFIGSINVNGVYILAKMDATNTTSLQTIGEVNNLLVGTALLDSVDTFFKNVEAAYKKLDSKEKKLVSHYAMISTAKKDSKAVRTVVELVEQFNKVETTEQKEAAFAKYKTAYNKLTLQQLSLFNEAVPTPPTLD